ncbi:MAG: carbohydrate ABC transporter permease [Spirochaetaceae bacterium]
MNMTLTKRLKIDSDKVFDKVIIVILSVVFVVTLYPLYFVVIASISDAHFVNRGEVFFLPKQIHLGAYKMVLTDPRILMGYKNTIIYTVFGSSLAVIMTVFAAFSLSRRDMVGYKFIIWFFLLTMYFRGGLIPTYIQVQKLGLINTRAAVVIVGSLGIWNLIIAKTFFSNSIPEELWEAANIDGCNMFQFFFRIVLPNSKAIIAIMFLYYAVGQWNDYFKSLIYLNQMNKYPLQLILRDILLANQSVMIDADPEAIEEMTKQAETMKYAMIIVASLPIIMIYPLVQKHFVKGVMIGSIKG